MTPHHLTARLTLPLPVDAVFGFFAEAGNLERITPPELRFRITTPDPIRIQAGTVIDYTLTLFGIRFAWRTLIPVWEAPRLFIDEQLRGPYALWRHTHRFTEKSEGTEILDEVDYTLPLHPVSLPALPFVRSEIRRIFTYRQQAVPALLGVPSETCTWEVHA